MEEGGRQISFGGKSWSLGINHRAAWPVDGGILFTGILGDNKLIVYNDADVLKMRAGDVSEACWKFTNAVKDMENGDVSVYYPGHAKLEFSYADLRE